MTGWTWLRLFLCAAVPVLLLLLLRYNASFLPQVSGGGSSVWSKRLRSRRFEADPYDPHHHIPSSTPWFEGWYTRASLSDASVAFVIGAFSTSQPPSKEADVAACFVIIDTGTGSPSYLSLHQAAVQVTRKPNLARPSFQVIATALQAPSGSRSTSDDTPNPPRGYCNLTVDSGHIYITFSLKDELLLEMSSEGVPSAWLPWSPGSHPSPEAYVSRLLDLHYHVYSLATPARVQLQWLTDQRPRQQELRQALVEGGVAAHAGPPARAPARDFTGPALLHMEKNWGSGFPPRWIWAQGHLKQPQEGFLQEKVAFVLAGGSIASPFPPLLPDPYLYVLSIRSTCQQGPAPAAGGSPRSACTPLDVQVDPWDPALLFEEQVASCNGAVVLKLFSSSHIIEVHLTAPSASFTPLPCPSRSGTFQDAGSEESFQATAAFRVWTRPFPFAPLSLCTLAAELSFNDAALEFGGAHMCRKTVV